MTATMLERSPDLGSQRQEGKESMLDTIRRTLDTAVEDDPANGVYRVSRHIFTDPKIFARFESYRGFLFGSLNPDVPPLATHLGEATKIIDLIVDQSPEGLEVLRP